MVTFISYKLVSIVLYNFVLKVIFNPTIPIPFIGNYDCAFLNHSCNKRL